MFYQKAEQLEVTNEGADTLPMEHVVKPPAFVQQWDIDRDPCFSLPDYLDYLEILGGRMMDKELSKADMVPDQVGHFIDEDLLPEMADGFHSAKQIAVEIREQAESELEDYFDDPKHNDADNTVIWAWLAQKEAKALVEDYVNRAFFLWGEE